MLAPATIAACSFFLTMLRRLPTSPLFPYTTLFRSERALEVDVRRGVREIALARNDCMVRLSSQAMWHAFHFRWGLPTLGVSGDRKSTRLNSSHQIISYAVFCLKKKKFNPVDANNNV